MGDDVVPIWPLLVIVFGCIALLIILWVAAVWLTSLLSGWQQLAQRYHSLRPTTGKEWQRQSGKINRADYIGALNLTANPEGLFLETGRLFGVGHNRIFIPWHEFHEAHVEKYLLRRQIRAKVGFPTQATVSLPAVVFEESDGSRVLVGPR